MLKDSILNKSLPTHFKKLSHFYETLTFREKIKTLHKKGESPSVCFSSLGDSDQVINGDLCLQYCKGGDEIGKF